MNLEHVHKPYYCYKTGGMRCRKCKKVLNDFGQEYRDKTEEQIDVIRRVSKKIISKGKKACLKFLKDANII